LRIPPLAAGLVLSLLCMGTARAEPVDLVVDDCLRDRAGEIRRLVEMELGPVAPGGSVEVEVACAADGFTVTVVDRQRGALRFEVDAAAVPASAHARLIALTVAEAVAASRIELAPPAVAGSIQRVPFPETREATIARPIDRVGIDDAPTLHGLAAARTLGLQATTVGGGVAASVPIGRRTALSGDLVLEGGLSPVSAGNVHLFLASLAPRLVARGRLRSCIVEAGAGLRVGLARLSGESSDPMMLEGRVIVAPWGGPIAVSSVRFPLGSQTSVGLGLEAGYTTLSVVGRVPMEPPVELRGAWVGLHMSAGLDLR
jgi:hypothetical protein